MYLLCDLGEVGFLRNLRRLPSLVIERIKIHCGSGAIKLWPERYLSELC